MKTQKSSIFIMAVTCGLFLTISYAQASENACRAMLRDGLYKSFNMTKSTSFNQDMKTYLSSSLFTRDYKDGKWGGSLSVVVEAIPITLGVNASDTELHEFQKKVKSASSFSMSETFYQFASTRIPDSELAKIYSDCVVNTQTFGLKIDASVHEKDSTFFVKYRNQVSTDPMPKVTFFDIRGARNIKNALVKGDVLKDVNVVSCDRDSNTDLTILIETDRGGVSYYVPAEPSGFNADMPVGTIITSYLTWTEFQAITKNNSKNPDGDFWTSKYSKWCPADGREVRNSGFERATGKAQVTDLRGRFVRGLNSFDAERPAITADQGDPETRERGQFQSDDYKSHTHAVTNTSPAFAYGASGMGIQSNKGKEVQWAVPSISINHAGGVETRPKNVAIYYYLRIN